MNEWFNSVNLNIIHLGLTTLNELPCDKKSRRLKTKPSKLPYGNPHLRICKNRAQYVSIKSKSCLQVCSQRKVGEGLCKGSEEQLSSLFLFLVTDLNQIKMKSRLNSKNKCSFRIVPLRP